MSGSSVEDGLLGSRVGSSDSSPRAGARLAWLPGPWVPVTALVAVLLTLGLLSSRAGPTGAGVRFKGERYRTA